MSGFDAVPGKIDEVDNETRMRDGVRKVFPT